MHWNKRSRLFRWLAMGTMAAYATGGARRQALAQQAPTIPTRREPNLQSPLPMRRFDIPAGSLDAALLRYHSITGLTVDVQLPPDTLPGFRTAGVTGLYTAEQALRLMLTGTGLSAVFPDKNTVLISIRNSETVEVTGNLPEALTMHQFSAPLLNTAQSVNVVPVAIMQSQGISTLRDTLRNVPGISLAAGEGSSQGDNLTIRGFTARNDIYLDGIRDFGSYYRDDFNYDSVEVLEGPAGVQFGRGSTGGVVNQVSKQPGMVPITDYSMQLGTDLTRRFTVDLNRPFPTLLHGSAFRMTAMGDEANVAERDYAENRRFGFAPSMSIGLNGHTRATLSYFHLTESDTPDYGIPWLLSGPAPTARHNYFGFPDQNYLRTNDDIVTARADHDFNPSVTLSSVARFANYPRHVDITEPQICANSATSTSIPTQAGVAPAVNCPYTLESPSASIQVSRNEITRNSVEGDLWGGSWASMHFRTAGLAHSLTLGIEGGKEVSDPTTFSYTNAAGANTVPFTNLATPDPLQPFSGTSYISSVVHVTSLSVGLYALDDVRIGQRWEVSGGLRWDDFNTVETSYTGTATGSIAPTAGEPFSRIDNQPTYRAAIVFKPAPQGSLYFDTGDSFDPSAETLSLSAATSLLPPEENTTYEAGAKWQFLHGRLNADGAWFHTVEDNARETSPTNSNLVVLAGNQQVEGMQASLQGRLPGHTEILAGYAYLDSKVIASEYFPLSIGYPLANVPRQTFNLWLEHALAHKMEIGAGTNYVASRTASSTVPFVPIAWTATAVTETAMKQVGGYWVFNAMFKKQLGTHAALQANVNNLLNRFYIDEPHPGHLVPGPGANALIGINFTY